MARMSPVSTAVSGLPSKVSGSTVVSSVLGKQLRKRQESSGSAMRALRSLRKVSTAALWNLRSDGLGRPWDMSQGALTSGSWIPFCWSSEFGPGVKAEASPATVAVRRKARLLDIGFAKVIDMLRVILSQLPVLYRLRQNGWHAATGFSESHARRDGYSGRTLYAMENA